jgi:LysM repeat protein
LTAGPGLGYNRVGRRSVRRIETHAEERCIPFLVHARSTGEPDPRAPPRRGRDSRDLERPTPPRRARRRRHTTPWLQRNALSVAAVSILAAVLGLGFGLLQMISRPEPAPALLALGQLEPTATLAVSTSPPGVQVAALAGPPQSLASAAVNLPRQIQANARVLQPNYTVAAGDTLGQIAVRFNTSVERIQALNNLADPRALRIGTRLVIPPPL